MVVFEKDYVLLEDLEFDEVEKEIIEKLKVEEELLTMNHKGS